MQCGSIDFKYGWIIKEFVMLQKYGGTLSTWKIWECQASSPGYPGYWIVSRA
uniref:Uncharacterized protein n=1 Tax=Rhizophora mucronata TaxID=61149 RepID=A0A2P2P2B8_RHIMU